MLLSMPRQDRAKLDGSNQAPTARLTKPFFGGPPPKKGQGGPKGPAKGFAGDVQRTLDDLNVSGAARDKADRAVRDHQDMTRCFDDLLRAGAGHAVERRAQ
jgi:hypothetical protein